MSRDHSDYMEYLKLHHETIHKVYRWMRENLPDIFEEAAKERVSTDSQLYPFPKEIGQHDISKYGQYEFDAYADKHCSKILTPKQRTAYNYAQLHHHQKNAHHWQHWVLIKGRDQIIPLKMPLCYILDMVADWWSYSWMLGDLYEVYTWYVSHQDEMILHRYTRKQVERILSRIHDILIDHPELTPLPPVTTTDESDSDA